MLSKKKFDRIHHTTLRILEQVGLHIPNQEILRKLQYKGFSIDFQMQTIKFPPSLVEQSLTQTPKEVRLYYHASDQHITLGGGKTHFTPSGAGVAVFDLSSGERRESVSGDVKTLIQMQEVIKQVEITRPIVTASEFGTDSDVVEFYLNFRHTKKPFIHRTLSGNAVAPVLEMGAHVMGGKEDLRRKPCFCVVYCPNSPLSFAPENAECMLAFAKAGIPVLVLSMSMGGASAPATLWGQALLINVEVLGGITLIQRLYPGTPVLYGSVSSVFDMATGILPLGAPERGILHAVCADVARRYGIPSLMGGMNTDAKRLDIQSGFEKALTTLPLLGKADVIWGAASMDSANTYSFEQLLLDDEMISAMRRVQSGVQLNMLEEEFPLVCETGWSGNYLTVGHTLKHYRSFWRPSLMTRTDFDSYMASGESLERRCKKRITEMLSDAPPSVLSSDIDQELKEVLTKRGIPLP